MKFSAQYLESIYRFLCEVKKKENGNTVDSRATRITKLLKSYQPHSLSVNELLFREINEWAAFYSQDIMETKTSRQWFIQILNPPSWVLYIHKIMIWIMFNLIPKCPSVQFTFGLYSGTVMLTKLNFGKKLYILEIEKKLLAPFFITLKENYVAAYHLYDLLNEGNRLIYKFCFSTNGSYLSIFKYDAQ